MKTIALIRFLAWLLVVFTLFSCNDRKAPLATFSGATNEVLVIMDKNDWNSPAGDTVKDGHS